MGRPTASEGESRMPRRRGTDSSNQRELVRRPLLAHGEKLADKSSRQRKPSDKFHPRERDEAWSELGPQAEAIARKLRAMPEALTGRHVVFEATLHPNYLASSWFPGELLGNHELYVVGARAARAPHITRRAIKEDQATKTLLLAGTRAAVQSFARTVETPPSSTAIDHWDELRRFREIVLPSAERIVVGEPPAGHALSTWEAVLTHVFDDPTNEGIWADEHFAKWVAYLRSLGGGVDATMRRDVGGLTFVPVRLSGPAVEQAASFNLLRAIRPMPEVRPFPVSVLRMHPGTTVPSEASREGRVPDDAILAFDGGVNPNLALFRPFVTNEDLTTEPPDPAALRHGSLVTSALLYGAIDPGSQLPDPPARVEHHRILPVPPGEIAVPGTEIYWILDRIVSKTREKKPSIVSLSVGPNSPVREDAEPTRWTTELDMLAQDLGVTFVTAAGNNGEDDESLGLNRVQSPADMVNGISVGAVSRRCSAKDATRAPYSAVGPGREGQRVQPTGVAFGGSHEEPFVGIDPSGRLTQSQGTSFAAPTAARGLGDLHSLLDKPRRRPEVSRIFATHFAGRRRGHDSKLLVELGHGLLPMSYAEHIECPPNEVTVLFEEQLPRGGVVAFNIPLPEELPARAQIQLDWTLGFSTEVDPRDPSDYTLTGLDVIFRPDAREFSVTDESSGQAVRYLHAQRDQQELVSAHLEGRKISALPRSDSSWRATRSEQQLRMAGKWETIVRGRKAKTTERICKPRLDVTYLRREGGQLVSGERVEPLRFAMLVTLRAPKGVDLYDRVAADYPVLAPLVHVPVRAGVA